MRRAVVIVGGGIMGSAVAYFLASRDDAPRVVVLEPDPTYATASTPRSASAIRAQFNLGINVEMSRFGYDFFKDADDLLTVDGREVDIDFEDCPYLVLASPEGTERLFQAHRRQVRAGADVEFLLADELSARVDWLEPTGIGAGILGRGGEGWFEPRPALNALRRKAESLGVRYVSRRAAHLTVRAGRIDRVDLDDGTGWDVEAVVNAAGARAAEVSALAGVLLPVESRKRTAFVFQAARPPVGFTNLVDPTFAGRGVYARPYRGAFLAVTAPSPDVDVETFGLEPDVELFDEVIRPALSQRVRGFDDLVLLDAWAGHYEINTLDQNGIVGRHPEIQNLFHACGLSGHGVMHAPAIGRGLAELIVDGTYTTLDLSPLRYERIAERAPLDDVQASEHRKTGAGV